MLRASWSPLSSESERTLTPVQGAVNAGAPRSSGRSSALARPPAASCRWSRPRPTARSLHAGARCAAGALQLLYDALGVVDLLQRLDQGLAVHRHRAVLR